MSGTQTPSRPVEMGRRQPAERPQRWQDAVDGEIDRNGWRDGTRVDQWGEDVTVYTFDSELKDDLVFRPEGPPTFSLSIFLEGRGTFSVDGAQPLDIMPGSCVLFASKRYSSGENTLLGGSRFRAVDIRFEPALLEKLGGVSLARMGGAVLSEHSLPDQEIFLIGMQAPSRLLLIASSLMQDSADESMAGRLLVYSKAIEALGIALETAGAQPTEGPRLKPLNRSESEKVRAAITLIEQQFSADWTIQRLSREVGLNERRLKEGFRLMIGQSIHAYLRLIRIETAAELLSSGANVTEAALAVGFESLSHFSKVFRSQKGVLPSRYGSGIRA